MDTDTQGTSVAVKQREAERRMRTIETKTQIVKETFTPGVSLAEVARRHGVNANLLFTWRRQYQQGVLETRTRAARAVKLPPVVEETVRRPAMGTIEIEWPNKVRVRVAGNLPAEQLTAVLSAVIQTRCSVWLPGRRSGSSAA